jgi:hypothetical protein
MMADARPKVILELVELKAEPSWYVRVAFPDGRQSLVAALSRCRTKNATRLRLAYFQAIWTAARQVFIAAARQAWCV